METQRTSTLPAIEYAERSDPGRDPEKQVNEDVCAHRETGFGHLCVVCDGMGGHASGREAAELAVAVIVDAFAQAPQDSAPAAVLLAAIEAANRSVYAMPTDEIAAGRPGCTVVAVLLHSLGTEVAHVGDSRAYLVHEGQIFRLTKDHSIVQELVERGFLSPQQAAHHPDANRITRALGIAPEVQAEIRPVPVHHVAGDALVLCSDGLSDLVLEHEILAVVGSEPAAQAVYKLVDLANARGGHDNITVVVLRARESALGQALALPPTVAQTSVPTLRTVEAPPPPNVVFEAPHTQVMDAARPPSLRPIERAPLSKVPPSVRPATAVVAIGLVLACSAAALLGVLLVIHLSERSGKRNPQTEPREAVHANDAASDAGGRAAPTTLAPESVVLPSPSAPIGEPIAPLEPAPPVAKRHRVAQ